MKTEKSTTTRLLLANRLVKESKLVAKESMNILAEFEQSDCEWHENEHLVEEIDMKSGQIKELQ